MMRRQFNFWATLSLLFLMFFALDGAIRHFCKPRVIARWPPSPTSFPEVSIISNREEFFKICGRVQQDERRFDACRKKLYVLSTSFLWVDSRYLLNKGESLSAKHLEIFYGLSGAEAESSRMTIAASLVTRCRKGATLPAAPFEKLIDLECLRRIPTLAELGLETDPEWAGVQLVDSTYDGRMKSFSGGEEIPRRGSSR